MSGVDDCPQDLISKTSAIFIKNLPVKRVSIIDDFLKAYSESGRLLHLVNEELTEFNLLAGSKDSPFIRRLKVRVVFSCIEINLSHLKHSALAFSLDKPGIFSEEEQLNLKDKRTQSSKDGDKIVSLRMSLRDNVKFSFESFAKAIGKNHPVNFGDLGGISFLKIIPVRDRIIHPKTSADWNLSDVEMKCIDEAWAWFGKHLVAISKLSAE